MDLIAATLLTHEFDPAVLGNWPSQALEVVKDNELSEMQQYFAQFSIYQHLLPIATDNQSNYWCLYVAGMLRGMVCFLSHEEADLTPVFRSLPRFITAVQQHPDAAEPADFPTVALDFPLYMASGSVLVGDSRLAAQLREALAAETDEDVRQQLAFASMALTAPDELGTLYPFLDDEDMYVQERAIELLGRHRYQPAFDHLQRLLTAAAHNGRMAAKRALQRLAGKPDSTNAE